MIAVAGLGLNSAVVWLLAEIMGSDPTLAKIILVFPVFAWNYLGRRTIVFDGTPSSAMALLAGRGLGDCPVDPMGAGRSITHAACIGSSGE